MESIHDQPKKQPEQTPDTAPENTINGSDLPPDGIGYLIVRVTTARGAIPLEGISVTVRNYNPEGEEGRGSVLTTLVTDRSGNTQRLPLPAPPKELSEQPGNVKPYATYSIDIDTAGYYRQYYTNVPIFDGVTSVQQADLIPLAQRGRTDGISPDDRVFPESENPDL